MIRVNDYQYGVYSPIEQNRDYLPAQRYFVAFHCFDRFFASHVNGVTAESRLSGFKIAFQTVEVYKPGFPQRILHDAS